MNHSLRTADLDFNLPEALIAQYPAPERDEARLLVVDRGSGTIQEDVYRHIGSYLRSGDCLVLNDTRVIRARLTGRKASGGQVEVFLLRCRHGREWEALVRPSARVRPGTRIALPGGLAAVVQGHLGDGRRVVEFDRDDVLNALETAGAVPLPPYIGRKAPDVADHTRYQTVYARQPGAVAAPTAGLHLTSALLEGLNALGIAHTYLTLHVGYGTFKPVAAERLDEHSVDPEEFVFPEATAARLNATRARGGRVVAVGTTSTRVLETQCRDGRFVAGAGETSAYFYPPYTFRAVDALQTNFHLPKSSLLALVCAFAGTELTLAAYRHAVERGFRFYSYGDTMLIL